MNVFKIVYVLPYSGAPFARAHFNCSRCPFSAAFLHVLYPYGQPFARNH